MKPAPRSGGGKVLALLALAVLAGGLIYIGLKKSDSGNSPAASGSGPSGVAGVVAPVIPKTGTIRCRDVNPQSLVVPASSKDLVDLVRSGFAPSPIEPNRIPPDGAVEFRTSADFLAQASVPDKAARQRIMDADGFRGGIKVATDDVFPVTAQVLTFRDQNAVKDFLAAHLTNMCRLRGTDAMVPLGRNGFAFVDGLGATHAEFLVGSSQVSLTLCGCSPLEPVQLMRSWYLDWSLASQR